MNRNKIENGLSLEKGIQNRQKLDSNLVENGKKIGWKDNGQELDRKQIE